MGRAIDMENNISAQGTRIGKLEGAVEEILEIIDRLMKLTGGEPNGKKKKTNSKRGKSSSPRK